MTDLNELTNDEVVAHIRQTLKMERVERESHAILNEQETGIKPIPVERFLKLKLISKPII